MRTLTLRELNRAMLARQLLLGRRKLGVLAAIERLAGLQAQWPPSPYIGLWARVEGFRRETLEHAIRRGDVLRPTVMRGTLHLVTKRDYPTFYWALRDMRTWYGDVHLGHALELLAVARERAPLTMNDALAWLAEHGHADERDRRRIFMALRRRAHLLHHAESALWKSRPRVVFHAVEAPAEMDVLVARTELVRRYLGAFGPATPADVAAWSGLRVSDLQPALDSLEPLLRFEDENGRELLDLPRRPLPDAETPAPVRFLPKWDNLLLAHADRTRVISDDHRRGVVAKNGDVSPTFLVDGFVAGTWSAERDGTVRVAPFAPLPRAVRREVDEEARRLEAWLA